MKSYSKQIKILAAIGIALIAAVFLVAAFSPLDEQAIFRNTAAAESTSAQAAQEQSALFPVNLNTASAAQLQTVPGIGEKTAAKIVAYREAHGSFESVDELLNVSGIGEKSLEEMRDYLCTE